MNKIKKLDEGTIIITDKITASITLDISYRLKDDSYIYIKTNNDGGGNYINIEGGNDNDKDKSINICNFEDLETTIKHFKEAYSKIVINTKIK